jgi:hypothetical protein
MEKFGNDYEEQREIALQRTRQEVQAVYEEACHQEINDNESRLLPSRPLEQLLTWTKSHVDAYGKTRNLRNHCCYIYCITISCNVVL